jgi:hypothetical protein
MAAGKYGQYIFISPSTRVVIVRMAKFDGINWLAWSKVFQSVARQVGSGGGATVSAHVADVAAGRHIRSRGTVS